MSSAQALRIHVSGNFPCGRQHHSSLSTFHKRILTFLLLPAPPLMQWCFFPAAYDNQSNFTLPFCPLYSSFSLSKSLHVPCLLRTTGKETPWNTATDCSWRDYWYPGNVCEASLQGLVPINSQLSYYNSFFKSLDFTSKFHISWLFTATFTWGHANQNVLYIDIQVSKSV